MKKRINKTYKVPYVRPKKDAGTTAPMKVDLKGMNKGDSEIEFKSKRIPSELEVNLTRRTKQGSKKGKKRFYVSGNSWQQIRNLCRKGESFQVQVTNKTTKITTSGEIWMYSKDLYGFKELNLQRQLKEQFIRNIANKNIHVPHITQDQVSYFSISDFVYNYPIGKPFPPAREFDITKAYYNCAYNEGFIDKEFYELCINLKKKIRLRLIGSIATHKRIYEYKNGVLKSFVSKKDEKLRDAWFYICDKVGKCMDEFKKKAGKNFLYFWVDGICLKDGQDYSKIVSVLEKKHRFELKPVSVEKMEKEERKTHDGTYEVLNVWKEGKPKAKPFSLQDLEIE